MATQTNTAMPSLDEFRSRLKRHGLKATRQRLEVHEAMMALGHASADMVTEEIARRGIVKVTVASVYNILSQLADLKIYSRRLSSNNKMYFDINSFRHMHRRTGRARAGAPEAAQVPGIHRRGHRHPAHRPAHPQVQNRMKRLILVLCSVLVLAGGCKKQDSYTYSGIEAGTLGGGVFTSDNGTKMTVVGNEGKYDVTSTRRVLISYQTQPFTDPAHISIDLLGLLDAGILQPEHARSLPADPSGSPLEITDAWFSSEYLNILATFEGKDPEKHTFSAAYTADEKGLTLRIGHDGFQDETTGTKPLSIFLCVPMYEPVLSLDQAAQAAGQKPVRPVPVLLQWTSYTMDGGPLTLLEKKGSYLPPSAD